MRYEDHAAALPPRPGLNRAMMAFGFILAPTRFLEQSHAAQGDYFTLLPQSDRVLVVTADPAAVERIFKGDPNLLHAGAGNVPLLPILGEGSVLLLDGSEHIRHRRLMLPSFHGERMRLYGETMTAVASRHVAAWPRRRRFAALPSMQAITLEVIMRAVFGVEDRDRLERLGTPLRELMNTVGSRRQVLALGISARRSEGNGDTAPTRGPWARFAARRRAADAILFAEIRERRTAVESGEVEHDDVFSMLLEARDEDGNGLTDQELRDELMTLLVAGHETTATALAWTLERITRHPEVLERLRSEPEDTEYLDAVIKETLRLRPVVPAVIRQLQEPMEFGGYELPAGVNIAPSIYLLHRRPDLYPDPTAFRPERFLGPDAPGTYQWIPFGGGTRRCLGASFALFEMRVVLQTILREAALRPARRPASEGTTRRAITLAPARGGRIAVA